MKNRTQIAGAVLFFQLFSIHSIGAAEEIKLGIDEERSISINFDGAQLKDVLVVLSQQSGFNFVASQDVESKKVTVYLDNVSAKEALDAIVIANGLNYTLRPGNIALVTSTKAETVKAPVDSQSKVFRLKYARLSNSPLETAGQATIGDLKSIASASLSVSSAGSSSASSVSDPERGIDKVVAKFLSSQGKLAMDLRTNSLIVTDTPDRLEQIEKIIKQIDIPSRQVTLEVHVMEVEKGLIDDRGIQWGGSTTDGSLFDFVGGSRTSAFPFGESMFTNQKGIFKGAKPTNYIPAATVATAGDDQAVSSLTFGTLSAANFAATLQYLMTKSTTKTLARPKVLTQNNEAAEIKVLTSQTIGVTTSNTSVSGTVVGADTDVADRRDVGIQLKMTPQVNDDDSVMLFVEPSVSTATTSSFSDAFLDPRTRVIRTMARVKDNQTLVIGGIIEGSDANSKRKIPFLGDLPLIGGAFSYHRVRETDRELLIFITPHIVRGDDVIPGDSPLPGTRDLAVTRMLDEFRDKELIITEKTLNLGPQDFSTSKFKTKAVMNPAMDRLMSETLDSRQKKAPTKNLDQIMSKALDATPR